MGFSEPGGLEEGPLEQQPDRRDERGSMEAGRRLWEAGTSQLVLFPQEPREGVPEHLRADLLAWALPGLELSLRGRQRAEVWRAEKSGGLPAPRNKWSARAQGCCRVTLAGTGSNCKGAGPLLPLTSRITSVSVSWAQGHLARKGYCLQSPHAHNTRCGEGGAGPTTSQQAWSQRHEGAVSLMG